MEQEFGVLGPLRLVPDTLTAPKLRGLLALLLLDRRPVPAGQLRRVLDEGDCWQDATGPVYVAVHRLRRWLDRAGGFRLDRGPAGYLLDLPPGLVDADRFRDLLAEGREPTGPGERERRAGRLRSALSLWRGPVAADAPVAVRRQEAARRLDRLHRQALIELAGLDRSERTLPLIERAADAAPHDEQLQALLARCLAACGLQAEALDVLARARRALADDLGLDPGIHLREAHLFVLRPSDSIKVA